VIEEPSLLRVRSNFLRPRPEQIAAFQGVPTSFVADAMDGTGALATGISALGDGVTLPNAVAGPALTADNGPGDLLATLAAIRFLKPGDVLVAAARGHQGCAAAGDRLMGMARNGGAAGFVTDGPMRDYAGIVLVGLPAWCTGLNPASPVARGPGAVGVPILVGGRQVESGDMIVADRDGVVVVPYARLDAVIARLAKVVELETALDAEVAAGLVLPDNILQLLDSADTEYVD
jgi:4-hydroxy-4-methyl-2-oxoglutarate aldolase